MFDLSPGLVLRPGGRRSPIQNWLAGHFWYLAALVWVLGLLVRVPMLARDSHITNDIQVYREWLSVIGERGLLRAYVGTGINYPPLFVEWLAFSAAVLAHLPAWMRDNAALAIGLIKLPSLLADLLLAGVLAAALARLGRWRALAGAAAYLFNPAVWYVSSFWGQTDSLFCVGLVAAILFLQRGAVTWAWVALALAAGFKLQAVVVAPLLMLASLRQAGWRRQGAGLAAFGLVSAVIWAPWLLTLQFDALTKIAPPSAHLVVSAYNLWYLIRGGNVAGLLVKEQFPGLPLSYRSLSLAVYAGAVLAITIVIARTRQIRLGLAAAAYCTALFLFMYGVHERYFFPVLPLLVLAYAEPAEPHADGRGIGLAYVGLSGLWLYNLVTVASFNHAWWINIVAPQPETAFVNALRLMALLAAALNVMAGGWLFWRVARRPRPAAAP